MRNPIGQLLFLVAEALDRSMIDVPEVDLQLPSTVGVATERSESCSLTVD